MLQRCATLQLYTPSTGVIGLTLPSSPSSSSSRCLRFASLVQRDRAESVVVLAERSLGHTHRHHKQRHLSLVSRSDRVLYLARLERTDERRAETERGRLEREVLRRAARFELYEVLPEPLVQAAVGFGHRGVAGDEEDGTGGVHPGLVLQPRDLRDCRAEKLVEDLGISPVVVTRFVVDLPLLGRALRTNRKQRVTLREVLVRAGSDPTNSLRRNYVERERVESSAARCGSSRGPAVWGAVREMVFSTFLDEQKEQKDALTQRARTRRGPSLAR